MYCFIDAQYDVVVILLIIRHEVDKSLYIYLLAFIRVTHMFNNEIFELSKICETNKNFSQTFFINRNKNESIFNIQLLHLLLFDYKI